MVRCGSLAACVCVTAAAYADTPRVELGVGLWQHESSGTLESDDPLLAVPPGFELDTEQDSYERFGVRLGSAWWAPVLRARHTNLATQGRSFVDNSTVLFTNTTDTRTSIDFEQLEGLLYFTYGDSIRGELGGGFKKIDGAIQTTQVTNTTLTGEDTATAERDLSSDVTVLYGALYAEPVSWLSFGGEAMLGTDSGNDVRDYTFRFVVKPWTWMGFEGGYRLLTMKAKDVNAADYDLEFGGPYAGLSFLYGSKDAGLFSPDGDGDGVTDGRDRCADSTPGVIVDARGCEPDIDGDKVPDGRDDCRATPRGAAVDASGCHKDTDRDSVPDGLDGCPNTAAGVVTDPQGCAVDGDADGVPDGTDQCPDTASATEVGRNGCPVVKAPRPAAPALVAPRGPDDDADGVADAFDRCPATLPNLKVDETGCATAAQSTVLQGITFQKNSSYLMRDSEVLLLKVVDSLKAQRTMRVVIQGHTCDLGDASYNKWLSQRRANRVLEFLVRHGIDAGRLLAVGYGEEQPLVPNDDERMRELNRRTVFAVVEQ